MPKQFITERDIEDMARRGEMQLSVSDETVLTDLAYEKAQRLGVSLLKTNLQPPAAPVRPYLSSTTGMGPIITPTSAKPTGERCNACMPDQAIPVGELKKRVIEAVTNRLGGQVDGGLLATIVERVLSDLGVR